MTRKEAIAELKRDIELDNDFTEDYINAVNMAIKALEQEECEDAVSRQAVKEQMIYYGFHAPDMTVTEFVEDCLPSVNPQKPQKGYISIDDVMLVFDVFMYGEVDKEGAETFLEMLKDKAESEG